MRNKRLAIIASSVVAVIIVALLVIPGFIDWSKYQQVAKDKIAQATGYELTIGGAFRAGFLPRPHLNAENIILRKPAPGKGDTFIALDGMKVTLAFWPLLVGNVDISSITLDKPVVTMVTYKDGSDNWKPKEQAAPSGTDSGTAAAAPAGDGETRMISVGAFHIKGGQFTLRDEIKGTSQTVAIDEMKLKAESMSGPFEGEGQIGYNNADIDIDFTTGGYKKSESMPLQIEVKDDDGRLRVKFNGVIVPAGAWEAQGETSASFTDLAGFLKDAGIAASVPSLGGETAVSGMLTAKPDRITLTNGNAKLGGSKMTASLDWSKSASGAQNISAALNTADAIDIDELLKVAEKVAAQTRTDDTAKPAATQKPSDTEKVKPLLPATLSLPSDMTGDVVVRAGALKYKGEETGAVQLQARLAGGSANARLTLASIPGGGDVAITGDLCPGKPLAEGAVYTGTLTDPAIQGKIIGTVESLSGFLSDWLKLVDKKTLDKPGMPHRIDADVDFTVTGYTARADLKTLSLGETKLNGTVTYTAAKRPVVNAVISANTITLPQDGKAAPKTEGKKADDKKNDGKTVDLEKSLEFDPPQLPFDLKFDIRLGRFTHGDLLLSDLSAAGTYDGKGLSLTGAQATTKGGTLSAAGRVADLKALSGIDVQAGLKTDDLESFYSAVTGQKLALEQKIGSFAGSAKLKGDKSKMDVAANAQARGFSIDAAGVLDDPFNPDLPGTLNVRVRHADFVQAMRVFSPGFGSGTGSPIDLAGNVAINGKVYEIRNLKGSLGTSDIAGDLKADLSGQVPFFKADLTSKTLGLGDFVGVKSKTPGTGASGSGAGGAAAAGTSSHWSREALDTGFMKAVNLDLSVKTGTLTYGSWVLSNASFGAKLADGKLSAPVSAKLYGGSMDGDLSASSAGDGAPLNIAFKANAKDVNIGSFLSALTSSARKKADGTGSVDVDVKGAGTSAATLMGSLAGKADIATRTLVIYGIDLDKLAANTVEAFDGGWKGVLAGVTTQGFAGGNTEFKDVDHQFALAGGNMPVKDFTLVTTSGNATMVSNGNVNFASWNMDLDNQVKVTQPKDVPVIGLRLAGPLDSPQKSVNSAALDNLLRGKVNDKLQDAITDKLGEDSKAGQLINNLLGGSKKTQAPAVAPAAPSAPAPAATTVPEAAPAPAATPEAAPAPASEAAPAEPRKMTREEKIEQGLGVLNQMMGGQ